MSDKQKKSKKKKTGKVKVKKSLVARPHDEFRRLCEFSQMLVKEYGPLRSVLEGGKLVRRRERDIPYGWPSFIKGTEAPVYRLKLTDTIVTLTASTLYNSVYNLQAQYLQNFDDAANMFDEYRFIRGHFEMLPQSFVNSTAATPQTNYTGGACVDYGVSGVLGSINAGIGHDTWKWCQFVNTPGLSVKNGKGVIFPVRLEKLTDETWIPTTTNNSSICFWKPYIPAASIPWTVAAFHIIGEFDVQFRGQAG